LCSYRFGGCCYWNFLVEFFLSPRCVGSAVREIAYPQANFFLPGLALEVEVGLESGFLAGWCGLLVIWRGLTDWGEVTGLELVGDLVGLVHEIVGDDVLLGAPAVALWCAWPV